MSASKPGARNLAALLTEKVLQLLAVAAVNVVVLRTLGPGTFGYLGAATSILAIMLPLSNFGQIAVVRFLSTRKLSERRLVSVAVLLSSTGSFVGFLGMLFLGYFLVQDQPTNMLLLVLAFSMLARPLSAVDAWFQANKMNSLASLCRLSAVIICSIARVAIVLATESLVTLAWIVVLENVLGGIFLAVTYLSRRGSSRDKMLAQTTLPIREILKLSLPLLLSGFAIILYMRVNQPILLWLTDSTAVGHYSAAANLADAVSFIPTALLTAVLPGLVAIHGVDRQIFQNRAQTVFRITAALGYTLAVGGVLLGPFAVSILYGPEYVESGVVLQILFVGAPFVFLGVMRNVWIVIEGLQFETLALSILTVVTNLALNIWLISLYGAMGAAIATVLAHLLNGFLGNVLFKRTRPFFVQQLRALNPISAYGALFSSIRSRKL